VHAFTHEWDEKVASWFVTFIAVVFAWVFFRAQDVVSATSMINGMLGQNGLVLPAMWVVRLNGTAKGHKLFRECCGYLRSQP
jgi:hypothetical protein